MKQVVVSLPDGWPKNKHWNSATMMNCDKCEFHTPDAAIFLKHSYDHILLEDQPETLTTAP